MAAVAAVGTGLYFYNKSKATAPAAGGGSATVAPIPTMAQVGGGLQQNHTYSTQISSPSDPSAALNALGFTNATGGANSGASGGNLTSLGTPGAAGNVWQGNLNWAGAANASTPALPAGMAWVSLQ